MKYKNVSTRIVSVALAMMDDTNARVFRKTKAEATPKMTATDVVGTDHTQAKSKELPIAAGQKLEAARKNLKAMPRNTSSLKTGTAISRSPT